MGSRYSIPATLWFPVEGLYLYSKHGYEKHSRRWDPQDLDVDLTDKVFIVTGGNSGIGFQTCEELLKRNATVLILGRNREKLEKALNDLKSSTNNFKVEYYVVDVSSISGIKEFCQYFLASGRRLDCLINNAGQVLNERTNTPDGTESTFATHTLGTFLLTEYLMPALIRSAPSRVVIVSSGGMYTQKIDVEDFQNQKGNWDGLRAYSQTKRQLVYLTETWAKKYGHTGVTFNSMHPGWVDTPAVRKHLPNWFTKLNLRTVEQGADTIVWLAISSKVQNQSGKFWFDREPVKINMPFANTQSSQAEIDALYTYCNSFKS